jgi:hypothetical protein
MITAAAGLPRAAYNPDSPDAAILAAWEMIRANRAMVYSHDGEEWSDEREAITSAYDDEQYANEALIEKSQPRTPSGVALKLKLQITGDCERWIDSTLCTNGVAALHARRSEMEGNGAMVLDCIVDLIRIEWQQALAAYDEIEAQLTAFNDLYALVEENEHGAVGPDDLATRIGTAAEAFQHRICSASAAAMRRLVRTLTPDRDALMRKLGLLLGEGCGDDAPLWLARDISYLTGQLEAPKAAA